jgi:hypothetical protein
VKKLFALLLVGGLLSLGCGQSTPSGKTVKTSTGMSKTGAMGSSKEKETLEKSTDKEGGAAEKKMEEKMDTKNTSKSTEKKP